MVKLRWTTLSADGERHEHSDLFPGDREAELFGRRLLETGIAVSAGLGCDLPPRAPRERHERGEHASVMEERARQQRILDAGYPIRRKGAAE